MENEKRSTGEKLKEMQTIFWFVDLIRCDLMEDLVVEEKTFHGIVAGMFLKMRNRFRWPKTAPKGGLL
jgi:hypothetical protein